MKLEDVKQLMKNFIGQLDEDSNDTSETQQGLCLLVWLRKVC